MRVNPFITICYLIVIFISLYLVSCPPPKRPPPPPPPTRRPPPPPPPFPPVLIEATPEIKKCLQSSNHFSEKELKVMDFIKNPENKNNTFVEYKTQAKISAYHECASSERPEMVRRAPRGSTFEDEKIILCLIQEGMQRNITVASAIKYYNLCKQNDNCEYWRYFTNVKYWEYYINDEEIEEISELVNYCFEQCDTIAPNCTKYLISDYLG